MHVGGGERTPMDLRCGAVATDVDGVLQLLTEEGATPCLQFLCALCVLSLLAGQISARMCVCVCGGGHIGWCHISSRSKRNRTAIFTIDLSPPNG
jgi:hypothetical protein